MPHHNTDTPLNPKYYSYTDTVDFLEAIDFKLLFCTLNLKTMVDKLILKISKNKDAWEREVGALHKLPKVIPCKRGIILTYDEQQIIEDEYGKIEVIPCWKWLIDYYNNVPVVNSPFR